MIIWQIYILRVRLKLDDSFINSFWLWKVIQFHHISMKKIQKRYYIKMHTQVSFLVCLMNHHNVSFIGECIMLEWCKKWRLIMIRTIVFFVMYMSILATKTDLENWNVGYLKKLYCGLLKFNHFCNQKIYFE